MRKIIFILPIIIISTLLFGKDAKPKKDLKDDIAKVTSYVPVANQKLIYDINIDKVHLKQHITIITIKKVKTLLVSIDSYILEKGKTKLVKEVKANWESIKDSDFKVFYDPKKIGTIIGNAKLIKTEDKIYTISGYHIKCRVITVSIKGLYSQIREVWFAAKKKSNVFPGVVKVIINGKIILKLEKIIAPKKKKQLNKH